MAQTTNRKWGKLILRTIIEDPVTLFVRLLRSILARTQPRLLIWCRPTRRPNDNFEVNHVALCGRNTRKFVRRVSSNKLPTLVCLQIMRCSVLSGGPGCRFPVKYTGNALCDVTTQYLLWAPAKHAAPKNGPVFWSYFVYGRINRWACADGKAYKHRGFTETLKQNIGDDESRSVGPTDHRSCTELQQNRLGKWSVNATPDPSIHPSIHVF